MTAEVFLDANGNYDEGHYADARSREEVLPDYRLHQLLDDEIGGVDINEALEQGYLEEALPDNRIYFVNKYFHHTEKNTILEDGTCLKIGEGPENKGEAGDIDVGFIDLSSGKLRRIELKSPSRIPERAIRERQERSYPAIDHAEEQNAYLARLLDHYEQETGRHVPYSPRVEAWNDAVEGEIQNINQIPKYSENGCFVASGPAIDWAQNSDRIQQFDDAFFKYGMLGGGEDILAEMGLK
mgnify:CR=1 FL=1